MFWQNAYAGTISLPQASTIAPKVDNLYDFIFWLSVVSMIGITAALVIFVRRYHKSKTGRMTEYILDNHKLEALWTIVPLIGMLFIFAWGFKDYLTLRTQDPNAFEINVVGRQWMWNMEYPNGRKTLNELYLPKGKPVKLILTSEDVLHSFFMPAFRLKQDAVPGIFTSISFEATQNGVTPIYCAEYCGTAHSDMLGKIYVVEPEEFEKWLATGKLTGESGVKVADNAEAASASMTAAGGGKTKSAVDRGREYYQSKTCFTCHSMDGTPKVGPSFAKLFGKEEEFADGTKGVVDENYIVESILEPTKKVVKGFVPTMPPFKGVLKDDEIKDLVAFIKSLK